VHWGQAAKSHYLQYINTTVDRGDAERQEQG
jgi:hypothetical protein